MYVYTRPAARGQDRCPRCKWLARGTGFGPGPIHTCDRPTVDELAQRQRTKILARLNQRTR